MQGSVAESWADCSSSSPCAAVQSVVLPSGLAWVEILHDSCVVMNATSIVSPPGFFDAAASGAPIARWCPCPAGFWCDAGATAESHASCADTDDCAVGACPAGYKCYAGTAGDRRYAVPCTPDHYCPEGTGSSTQQQPCPAGTSSAAGASSAADCAAPPSPEPLPPLAPPAPPPNLPPPNDAGPQPGFAVVFFLLGCLVGSLTCGIALAVYVTGRWSVRPPKGHREAAAALRRRDEVRAAKAQGAKASLENVGRQQTLSHEEIARRSLEEAKLAGEVSEHILRRAPAAAPVAAPADDCIPEERLSQTRFSSQDSLAA